MNYTKDLLLQIFDVISEGVYLLDESRTIVYWNGKAEEITGYTSEEVLGRKCSDNILNHIDDSCRQLCGENCPLKEVMQSGKKDAVSVFLHNKEGFRVPVTIHAIPVKDETGKVTGVLEVFSDTSEIRLTQRKIDLLNEQLYTDALTKVGNRRFCDRELRRIFEDYAASGAPFSAALCDIDNFKNINDTYGHDFGDKVLAMVAKTLFNTLRDGDVVSRWGGEEFLLIFSTVHDRDELFALVERVRILIGESFLIHDQEKISVTASFGAAVVKKEDTEDTLFKRMDTLLYQSKKEGKNRVSVE